MEQSGKKNAKRYLVIAQDGKSATVWAEDTDDVLAELEESQQVDTPSFGKEDIKLLMLLD